MTGIYEALKLADYFAAPNFQGTDLGDSSACRWGSPRSFQV
jgi:hypothetical protein